MQGSDTPRHGHLVETEHPDDDGNGERTGQRLQNVVGRERDQLTNLSARLAPLGSRVSTVPRATKSLVTPFKPPTKRRSSKL